jgi:hypothetical protein
VIKSPDQPEHHQREGDDAEHCHEISHAQQYPRERRKRGVNEGRLRVNEA